MDKKFCILIKISLKFVPKVPIDNNPAFGGGGGGGGVNSINDAKWDQTTQVLEWFGANFISNMFNIKLCIRLDYIMDPIHIKTHWVLNKIWKLFKTCIESVQYAHWTMFDLINIHWLLQ